MTNDKSAMANKLLHATTCLMLLPALYTGFYFGKIVFISAFCMLALTVLYLWLIRNKYIESTEFDNKSVFLFYIAYMIFTYVRSFFNVEDWRDYIPLFSGFFEIILVAVWLRLPSVRNLGVIWKSFMTIGLLMNYLMTIYEPSDGMMTMAHNMIWMNVFIFLFPYIKLRHWLMIVVLALFVVLFDINRRSIMLGYVVAMVILVLYRFVITKFVKKVVFYGAVLLPLVLSYMFMTKTFNVFEHLGGSNEVYLVDNGEVRALFTDSRTGIYQDVVDGVFKTDNPMTALIGLGGNGKVRTLNNGADSFGFKGVRSSQEAAMLNFVQHGGLLGLLAYSLLILLGSYKCVFKARNKFMIMLGYFLLFKYVYSFVEDQITFNAHSYYQFLWYGMAYNYRLRNMTDLEFKSYIRKALNLKKPFKSIETC